MAILYVRSTDGNDADNGSTWALAKATLAGAISASSAGDTIYVSDNHAETQASAMSLAPKGTAASPNYIVCVDDSAEPPTALATSATITTTGSNALSFTGGFAYFYGITFSGATSGTQGTVNIANGVTLPYGFLFKNCIIKSGAGLTSANHIKIGSSTTNSDDQIVVFDNTIMQFVDTTQTITINGGRIIWKNTSSAVGGTAVPSVLISPANIGLFSMCVNGVDLSALGSGDTIVNTGKSITGTIQFNNCKLGSSVSLTSGSIGGPGGLQVTFINCDSADTNYRYWYQDYAGTIEHETTIVRTGGASNGTTPISREVISSANAELFYPLTLKDIAIWNETTGSSITLTVHIVTDNVTLTDKECWLEVEYLGTSGTPLSLFASDSDSITDLLLGGSASNQTTSTETWTTTGLTTPVKQQLSVTITPQEKGPILCKVVLAKPSTTVYVCPKVVIT